MINTYSNRLKKGITQVEILMVAVIMGVILSAASLSFYQALKGAGLQSLADKLSSDLEYARTMAIQNQKSWSVQIQEAQKKYRVLNDADTVMWEVGIEASPYKASLISYQLTSGPKVAFDRYGKTGNTGTVTVTVGDRSKTVQITATGLIKQL